MEAQTRKWAVLLIGVVAALVPAGTAAAQGCANVDVVPDGTNAAQVEKALICLLNQERVAVGVKKLKANKRLRKAATKHSRNMVAGGFFDHVGPAGDDLVDRATKAKYLRPGAASWYLSENIGWGTPNRATAQAIMDGWIGSAPHRVNMLSPRARDVGVGIAQGSPFAGDGSTFTLDFGRLG